MSELDAWDDVLPVNLRRVWPHVADCANRIGGALMGGTAVAIHLRHRVSEDLDVAPSITVEGMQVASIADLVVAKLDVIRFRPKLRDYLDLAAIDRSGACSLEAGLGYYCRRFGYAHPPRALEEIVTLLDRPGTLPADPAYEERRADALSHLRGRVPQLRDRIAEMRDVSVSEPTAASAQRARGKSELRSD
ncbi:MAG: hypothetical protein OXH86_08045 [Acidimicrobiaceae bacterium]|nr:hypothetical protein [Acidimicrobiaceae bacterium]MDE0497290.1 hypothetical protein [Acidimicrobiaceae bacterium]